VHSAVLHCNVPDDAERLAAQIAARFKCVELLTTEAGPTIGAHGGRGHYRRDLLRRLICTALAQLPSLALPG